jgi:UDP-N-acetylmuramate dehydrogenase
MNKFEKLKDALGKEARVGEQLASHTTLKIGGQASLFVIASEEKEFKNAIKLSKMFKVDFLIMGGGSNLLVHDEGYKGLVIKNTIQGVEIVNGLIRVKSGTILQNLIDYLIRNGFSGMERMAGIPGTVGGAIYGNAGAYGQTISDNLIRIKILEEGKIRWFSKQACKFGYRESIFKKNDLIILEAEFKFKRGVSSKLKKATKEIIRLRSQKYPKGMLCPGSFFKNVLAKKVSRKTLKEIPKEKIIFNKIPAGYLLSRVGARGKRKGDIEIADYHGNLFFNKGEGKASDFYYLAKLYRDKVGKKFGIKLEPEVQLIGFAKKYEKFI